jgi:hypothetical protein
MENTPNNTHPPTYLNNNNLSEPHEEPEGLSWHRRSRLNLGEEA